MFFFQGAFVSFVFGVGGRVSRIIFRGMIGHVFVFSHTLEVPGPLRSLEIGKDSMCKAWKWYQFFDI